MKENYLNQGRREEDGKELKGGKGLFRQVRLIDRLERIHNYGQNRSTD